MLAEVAAYLAAQQHFASELHVGTHEGITVVYKLFRTLYASTGITLDDRKVWCLLHDIVLHNAASQRNKKQFMAGPRLRDQAQCPGSDVLEGKERENHAPYACVDVHVRRLS